MLQNGIPEFLLIRQSGIAAAEHLDLILQIVDDKVDVVGVFSVVTEVVPQGLVKIQVLPDIFPAEGNSDNSGVVRCRLSGQFCFRYVGVVHDSSCFR